MPAGRTLLDAHAHLHDGFDVVRLLERAHANLSAAARTLGPAGEAGSVLALLVAALPGSNADLRVRVRADPGGGWTVRPAGEAGSVLAVRGEDRLLLLPARQLATREGLEVLVAGADPSGEPEAGGRVEASLARIVSRTSAGRGLAVVPWGFGKWWGRRGRVLRDLVVRRGRESGVLLGDSALRPWGLPGARVLRRARRAGVGFLCGSDPLPLPGQEARVGGFGSVLSGALPEERPLRALLALTADGPGECARFGRRSSPAEALALQLRLRSGAG